MTCRGSGARRQSLGTPPPLEPTVTSTARGGGRGTGRRRGARQQYPSTPSPLEPTVMSTARGGGRGRGKGTRRGRGRSQGRGQQQARESESGEEEGNEWSSESSSVVVEPFNQAVGPITTVEANPVDTFTSLFTPALIDHIVSETNRYAALCLTSTHQGEGPPPTWETDCRQMKAYLGLTS